MNPNRLPIRVPQDMFDRWRIYAAATSRTSEQLVQFAITNDDYRFYEIDGAPCQITLSVSPDKREKLEEIAAGHYVSLVSYMRASIQEFLSRRRILLPRIPEVLVDDDMDEPSNGAPVPPSIWGALPQPAKRAAPEETHLDAYKRWIAKYPNGMSLSKLLSATQYAADEHAILCASLTAAGYYTTTGPRGGTLWHAPKPA